MNGIESRASVCEVEWFGSVEAGTPPDLLLEVPHGATRRTDYDAIRVLLSPELPPDLLDFFFVNTDVGASEYGRAVARRVTAARAGARPLSAVLMRCLVPRTFIDTNRVVDADRKGSGLTGALAEYIRKDADIAVLAGLHRSYHEVADLAYALVCGAGGLALMPHTYAPKSISIETIDEGIAQALRRAYAPELYATWPLRPEVDLITETPDGERLAPGHLVDRLKLNLTQAGIACEENASYRLHPITMGNVYSTRYPGQALCMEVRRDLLADPFSPFEEMSIAESKVERLAAPIAEAVLAEFSRRGP